MRLLAVLTSALLIGSAIAVPAAATAAQSSGYAGTNIEFATETNAVVDYRVDGATMFERVEVQSAERAESSGGLTGDASVASVTSVEGSGVEMQSSAEASTQAELTTESGATVEAHDNEHGIFVVSAGEQSQYVTANLTNDASAEAQGDRVVVTGESGAKGTFLVVGDGSVAVNEAGNVTAKLGANGKLVYRTYPDGERDDDEQKQEQWIQDGTAVAEVYVFQKGGETVADTVRYGGNTTVEVTERTESEVTFTAERSAEEGKVILTSVSEQVVESADDVSVTVDGDAAVEASSYSELEGALGGDTAKFLVASRSKAAASTDVLVAVDHFSERTVTVSDGGANSTDDGATAESDGTENGTDGSEATSTDAPGFGVGVALTALLAVAAMARRD